MSTMLACVSHSPIIMVRARAPADELQILAEYGRCQEAIREFDPELVVMFGTDHFAGFFLDTMPAYCVGLAAEAVEDVGGFGGTLDVPADEARALLLHVRQSGFDPAVSYRMTVDHAFSQPLHRLFGTLGRYPVIPVFIGALAPPFIPFARSRDLGAAVGRFVKASGKRTLLMGSGGMSHHPTRYYPLVGEGRPDVAAWQVSGEAGGTFTAQAWFSKLRDDHLTGAQMLVDGRRTAQDIRLNPAFDRWFMERYVAADVDALAQCPAEKAFEDAGLGALELHTWIAALAAHRAAGGERPTQGIYSPTLEYGIGYGMAYSLPP
jgi:2,3-dihydroxyphenylpropionate 1,2-dioxygenase